MSKLRLTPDLCQQAAKLAQKGRSQADIALALGIKRGSVGYAIKIATSQVKRLTCTKCGERCRDADVCSKCKRKEQPAVVRPSTKSTCRRCQGGCVQGRDLCSRCNRRKQDAARPMTCKSIDDKTASRIKVIPWDDVTVCTCSGPCGRMLLGEQTAALIDAGTHALRKGYSLPRVQYRLGGKFYCGRCYRKSLGGAS